MLCRLFVLSGRIFLILHRLIQHIPPRKYKSLSIYLTSSENLFMLSIFQNFDSKNNNTSTSNDKELCLAVGEMRDSWVRCRPVDYLLFHVIFLSFVLLKKLHWLWIAKLRTSIHIMMLQMKTLVEIRHKNPKTSSPNVIFLLLCGVLILQQAHLSDGYPSKVLLSQSIIHIHWR